MTAADQTKKATLRQLAEGVARQGAAPATEGLEQLSPDTMLQMLHELRVHQIDLELQNEELRLTQAALEASRARYFDFYDLAPVGYASVSPKGLLLEANLTMATLLGVDRNTLRNQQVSRYIDEKDQDRWYQTCTQLFENQQPRSCELVMVKQDGTRFPARLDAAFAYFDDGAPVLRMVLIDMTEKNAMAQQKDAFQQAILNSINANVAVLDQYGVIQAVNEPWKRFALDNPASPGTPPGYPGVGVNYLAACSPDAHSLPYDTITVRDGIQNVLDGKSPFFTREYPCHSPTQQRWFSMCAVPLGSNPKAGIVVTHTNITAHKQAEEDLRVAAAAFDVQDAIVVMDSECRILRANRAFTDITGYTESDIFQKTTVFLRSDRQPGASYEAFWRDMMFTGERRGGFWLKDKSGRDFFAEGTATAIDDTHGKVTHYVITFSNQTSAFLQEQQRQQHEAAQRGAVVREVHHRIKNNLQGIRGLLQQLAGKKPEIAEQMQLVMGHLQGISVIHGLQGRLSTSEVRLCELTSEIAQAASTLWQIPIPIDIPPAWVPRVVTEKEAVSMALLLNELIVNAVKHGGKAHGHVSITMRQGDGAEGADITILNSGHLRNNLDRPHAQRHGMLLIESLRPREGMSLALTQCGHQVCTLVKVSAPVLALSQESSP